MYRWWSAWGVCALLWLGCAHAADPWGGSGATLLAAQQDLNATRWTAAQQRLQPLLAPQMSPLVRGQAHLLLASSALRQGLHTQGVPHIRETLRLYRQPLGLLPPEAFGAMAGALSTATWLYAGAGLWPEAQQAAQDGLRRSLRWRGSGGGPGGSETLEFRKVLLSHALRQQRWGEAQTEVDALRPWLPPDAACADALCRDVQGYRLQLHKALGEMEPGYALAQAIQRNPAPIDPEAATWNAVNLSELAEELGRTSEALQWLDEALALGAPADSPPVLAARTSRLNMLAHMPDPRPVALNNAIAEVAGLAESARHKHGVASVERGDLLRLQAQLAQSQGDTATSLRLAAQALAIAWAANAPEQAWFAAMRMAHNPVHDGQVQVQAKIFYAKLVVNAAQAMRGGTLDLPTQRQQSFMSDKREDFVELADNLLDQRRLPEAEQLLAMAREDDYHQLVRSTEPRRQRLAFSGPEQAVAQVLAARRQMLEHATANWTRQLRPLGAAEQPVQQALEATVDALLAAQSLPPAPLLPEPVRPAPADGPSPTPHIYYLPTPERLRIAVVQSGATEVVDVPVTEAVLLRHIADLRRVLQNPATDARPQASALYAQLWGPIAHLLPTEAGSPVRLHPEGALRYLPFATLFDGRQWLVEKHALALGAGGSGTPTASAPRTGWALFGSSRGVAGLPPLAQVPGELAAIRQAHPATTALDARFTAPRLQAALAQRSVVHIASHFVLAPGDSAASWLQLGGGERVSLAALAGDAYRFDGLDLLTLSACDTAVPPGVDAQGRSLDSLAWLAHARGAKHVLASLWPVADASTAALMGRFYQNLADGQGKADALRAAQLAQLAQMEKALPVKQATRGLQPQPLYSAVRHPYYWGAFVLLAAAE